MIKRAHNESGVLFSFFRYHAPISTLSLCLIQRVVGPLKKALPILLADLMLRNSHTDPYGKGQLIQANR